MFSEVKTWGELARAIMDMPEADRQKPIQCGQASVVGGQPVELKPGLAIGTVEEMGFDGSRSIYDNRCHADDIVLLLDWNPFGDEGEMSYELKDGDFVNPKYVGGSPTPREDQMLRTGPRCEKALLPHEVAVIKHRMKDEA